MRNWYRFTRLQETQFGLLTSLRPTLTNITRGWAFICSSVCNFLNKQYSKGYSMGLLIFGRNIILLIENTLDWELIRQINQTKVNKDNIRENRYRIDHGNKVRYNVMMTKHTSYIYVTLYNGPFMITQCFTNGMVILQCVTTRNRYNIHHIKLYKSDTKVEYISSKNMSDNVSI